MDEWVLCKIYRKEKLPVKDNYAKGRLVGQQLSDFLSHTDLPPGFRFDPTDQELILHYLRNRATAAPHGMVLVSTIIADVDLHKFEPWGLPNEAMSLGGHEWYLFNYGEQKYATRTRFNRTIKSGYWKATGKDRTIAADDGKVLGFRKTLVFYRGRAPRGWGTKTSWTLHEYRLIDDNPISAYGKGSASPDQWLLCRIFYKRKEPDHMVVVQNQLQDDFYMETEEPYHQLQDNDFVLRELLADPGLKSTYSELFNY
ncbi:NAC transcription factor 29-like [Miscanthus floridulus]|uniref:NAC transcription factor 29-like n=1 Tax=Miscanthus floridulus TaxID=154761 RepID=UPI00345AFC21